MIPVLSRQQMGAGADRAATVVGGVLPRLALAVVVHPLRQDRSTVRGRAGFFDVFLASRRGLRAPANCRRPDYPSVACPASIYSRRVPSSIRAGQLGRAFLTGFFPIARLLPRACRRSAGGPSLLGQRIATHSGLSAVAGCRPKSFATARHIRQDIAEPSPVGLHVASPSYGSNRRQRQREACSRNRGMRFQK